MEQDESIALCEKLFADMLDGHKLISNARHLRGWFRGLVGQTTLL